MLPSDQDTKAAGREYLGWILHESGRESADHTVLLLPGALCTAAFYDDLLAEPSMRDASIRFVATTLPGFGGTAPLDDLSIENYAGLAGRLAADLGCDAVVGHSLGANVAIEMVASGASPNASSMADTPLVLRSFALMVPMTIAPDRWFLNAVNHTANSTIHRVVHCRAELEA